MVDLEAGGSIPEAPTSPLGSSPASAAHSLASGDIPASSSAGEMSAAAAERDAGADAQHLSATAAPAAEASPKSSPSKIVMKTVRTVLPKAEPLPWCTFFSLSFKVAIP